MTSVNNNGAGWLAPIPQEGAATAGSGDTDPPVERQPPKEYQGVLFKHARRPHPFQRSRGATHRNLPLQGRPSPRPRALPRAPRAAPRSAARQLLDSNHHDLHEEDHDGLHDRQGDDEERYWRALHLAEHLAEHDGNLPEEKHEAPHHARGTGSALPVGSDSTSGMPRSRGRMGRPAPDPGRIGRQLRQLKLPGADLLFGPEGQRHPHESEDAWGAKMLDALAQCLAGLVSLLHERSRGEGEAAPADGGAGTSGDEIDGESGTDLGEGLNFSVALIACMQRAIELNVPGPKDMAEVKALLVRHCVPRPPRSEREACGNLWLPIALSQLGLRRTTMGAGLARDVQSQIRAHFDHEPPAPPVEMVATPAPTDGPTAGGGPSARKP